jgi:hypothetical protein
MKIFLKFLLLIFVSLVLFNTYNLVNAKIYGKNNFELAKDPDFVGAVKLVINNYYHKGDLIFSNSIKAVIEQYCYVENNKIKCK